MKKKLFLGAVIALAVIALFLSSVNLLTDWQWFVSLGFLQMYIKPFVIQLLLFIMAFILGFVFIYINANLLINNVLALKERETMDESTYDELFSKIGKYSKWFKLASSALLSLMWAGLFQRLWLEVLYFFNGTNTGITDPIYNRDLAFYFFRLPFFDHIVKAFMSLFIITFLGAGIIYFLRGYLSPMDIIRNRGSKVARKSHSHLNGLLGLILLALGANAAISSYRLLYSSFGIVQGIGYVNYHITKNLYILLAVIGLLGFILSLLNLKIKRYSFLAIVLAGYFSLSILGGITGQAIQAISVSPNELTKERPFIAHHLEFTQRAYGLDKITEQTWDMGDNITDGKGLGPEIIENMRLADYRPLKDVFREAQAYRKYYVFNDIDISRFIKDGKYHQVMLSVREMDVDSLPVDAQTPINRHLKYTHGYGIVMSPVGKFTEGGFPRYYVQDMPLVDTLGLNITRPEVYFGELTNDFVLVNTSEKEFHYPGQEETYLEFEGETGIRMSFINRILFAIKESSSFLLFSGEYSEDSQILVERNIKSRVKKIAPFFEYEIDPYPAIADGKIYWIIDAYITSGNYPYSKSFATSQNYISNPVKAIVDAYSGEVQFLLMDGDEPFANAMDKAFPGFFTSPDDVSEDLLAQLRYPEQMFIIQANMLRNYHMKNPIVFYNREDAWDTPLEKYGSETIKMEPYYSTINLADSEGVEFVLMIPFTPVQRNNMIAWLGARNDGEKYGELTLYRFPSGTLIYGPQQIETRIDQEPSISEQLALWNSQGTRVIRGNLLVIPTQKGVLYVEPLYLQAQSSSFPEMRRVFAAYGEDLVMEPTLELALERLGLLGGSPGTTQTPDREDREDINPLLRPIENLLDIYNKAQQALKEGQWAEYGRLQEVIEDLLNELKDMTME